VSVTVTVNGKSGPSVVATNGDTISAAVTKNAVVSVSASAAAAPGGTGPTGPQGPPSTTITVGSVSTLAAGSSATVVGTSSNNGANVSLAFGIPAGAAGATGATGATPTVTATASTLSAGSSATVTATPSDGGSKVALAFGIPRGADGSAGSGGGASLSDATPSALGTASAGTSTTASRSDHVHLLPSLATLGAAAANHAHPYVTGLNSLTGTLTLAAGSGVTLTTSGSTITIAASGGSVDDIDGGDYVGVVASISFTKHPSDVSLSINQGSTGSASFTVAASASTGVAVAYQWQRNQGSAWTAIDGATAATLSLTGLTGADNGTIYRCVVNAFGLPSVISNTADLSVTVITPSTPVITIDGQPQNSTINNTASSTSFSVNATVTAGTLAYQWQKRESGATSWVTMTSVPNGNGETSSTLTLGQLTYAADNGDSYRCIVSAAGAASVTSATASLNVSWVTAPQITIIDGPATVNWPSSSNSCTVTFGKIIYGAENSGISFLWQANSTGTTYTAVTSVVSASNVFGGTTSSSLTLTGVSRVVRVRCIVTATNTYGTTTATTAAITINPPALV